MYSNYLYLHTKSLARPRRTLLKVSIILDIINKQRSSDLVKTIDRKLDIINIGETTELSLGHIGRKSKTRREADGLRSHLFLVPEAGDGEVAWQEHAGIGLLAGEHAAEVEALEVEVVGDGVVVVGVDAWSALCLGEDVGGDYVRGGLRLEAGDCAERDDGEGLVVEVVTD